MKLGAILAVAGVLAVPTVIELATPSSTAAPKAARLDMSIHRKSMPPASMDDDADAPLSGPQHAFDFPWPGPNRFLLRPMPPPGLPLPGLNGAPLPSPRAACEDDVDRFVGLAVYMQSKLRLTPDQKTAWQKLELAAEPGVNTMRDLCVHLPAQSAEPPALPDALDFAEKQMTARAELLRAVRGPLRTLYETMSPDQKAILRPHPFPPMPPVLPAHPGERL